MGQKKSGGSDGEKKVLPLICQPAGRKILLALILAGAAVALYFGWKLFWFLTDDAFISFRYVQNSIGGAGYVWNPPPFRPVEGYTSFLWVLLLDFIWRVFGLKPPEVVNYLSLGFSYLTLTLMAIAVMRVKLQNRLERFRLVFLFLILLGMLTNRTFLAWTSSGMETAMFNFFFTLWILLAFFGKTYGSAWLLGWSGSAVLSYLSRPEGILAVLGTLLFLGCCLLGQWQKKTLSKKWFLSASPLLVVAFHLGWRRSFYGEWLPNTYYAKVVAPWPEAGIQYLASFILEYSLWVWIFLFLVWVFARPKTAEANVPKKSASRRETRQGTLSRFLLSPSKLALSALIFQLAYYTFIVGGDHFEYRVYSYLVPIIFVSFLGLVNALNLKPKTSVALLGLFILLSWPIPWTHWRLTKNINTRKETLRLFVPVSAKFPVPFGWYTRYFDDLQSWLIQHLACNRHQEHKVFYQHQTEIYPSRQEGERIEAGPYPVMAAMAVGMPGWILPHVAIIDELGLNDYVIARSQNFGRERQMAHDRLPPPGYIESFYPNVQWAAPKKIEVKNRDRELTADYIIANEASWAKLIKEHKP